MGATEAGGGMTKPLITGTLFGGDTFEVTELPAVVDNGWIRLSFSEPCEPGCPGGDTSESSYDYETGTITISGTYHLHEPRGAA